MKRRRIVVVAAAAVIATASLAAWFGTHAGAHRTQAAEARGGPLVATASATEGTFVVRLTAQGRIGPPAGSSARVAFAQAGILSRVDVRVGESVAAGQALAELDRTSLGATLDQARADASAAANQYAGGSVSNATIRSDEAKLVLAESKLATLQHGGPGAQSDRIGAQQALRQAQLKVESDRAAAARAQTLFAGGVIAQKDLQAAQSQLSSDLADERAAEAKAAAADSSFSASLQQARADYASALNDLKGARAQGGVLAAQSISASARLDSVRIAYDQGVLRARADSVVLAILKHPGEAVDSSSPVLELGPDASNEITLNVPGDEARRIRPGDPVQFDLSYSGRHASGRVTAVVPAVDPATQSATVTVYGAPVDAVPGDALSATIEVDRLSGIIVPSSAIVQDPQTGKTVVFVRETDGTFASHEVKVRAADDRTALVRTGVRLGDRVATQGSYELLAPPGG
jgi:multidrug efflux pump subunit AcrA (membrane-fusion protein)